MSDTNVSDADLRLFAATAQEKTNLKLGYEIGQKYAPVYRAIALAE